MSLLFNPSLTKSNTLICRGLNTCRISTRASWCLDVSNIILTMITVDCLDPGNYKGGPPCETETSRQGGVGIHNRARTRTLSVRNRTGTAYSATKNCSAGRRGRYRLRRLIGIQSRRYPLKLDPQHSIRGDRPQAAVHVECGCSLLIHVNRRNGRLSKVAQYTNNLYVK